MNPERQPPEARVVPRTTFTVAAVVLSALSLGCARAPASADPTPDPPVELAIQDAAGNKIAVTGGLVELDDVEQGGQSAKRIRLRNVSQSALFVKLDSCSCECLTIRGLPTEVAPDAVDEVEVRVDLAGEPNFVGELDVEVLLYVRQSSGEVGAVPLTIRFRVVPRDSSRA